MHKAHADRNKETGQVAVAEHPVLGQTPAPILHSKDLLARHREDAAQAYQLYPCAKCCWEGLEMHLQRGTMNPSSMETTTNKTLCGCPK